MVDIQNLIIWGIGFLLVIGLLTWVIKRAVKIALKTALSYVITLILGLALIIYYGNIIFGAG